MRSFCYSTAALCCLFTLPLEADEHEEMARLIGEYEFVSGQRGGEEIPAERLKDAKVTIAKNAITTFDADEKRVYAATYVVDTSRQPWMITMTATVAPGDGVGTKAKGLIKVDGETLHLIYALPGGQPPKDFKAGENQQMFVLKKVKSASTADN